MEVILSFLREQLLEINAYTLIIVLAGLYQLGKYIINHTAEAGKTTFRLLEWYRKTKNRREHDRENIDKIDTIDKSMQKSIDKINVLSQMLVDLSKQISENEAINQKEHEQFREERRKDQLAGAYNQLTQAYRYYKSRAEDPSCSYYIGRKEWTCVERMGLFMMLDNYHDNGGDTYSHTVIEPYFQDWVIVDPENIHENDIYAKN